MDPAVAAIWPLQKHFPLAFPVNPAPKVPLKEGIFKDAEQHLELLGLTREQLKLGISTWCRGARYWASMVENAPRLDLNGQAAGTVTAAQALHASSRLRGNAARTDAIVRSQRPRPRLRPRRRHRNGAVYRLSSVAFCPVAMLDGSPLPGLPSGRPGNGLGSVSRAWCMQRWFQDPPDRQAVADDAGA